ncbi:MAG TPA: cation diffusion facilitator family transporter [Bacilli bacterium]|nr:cation diffusion facilitator family transporter [Bacilli bacterium]
MLKLLAKKFIKDHENYGDNKVRIAYGKLSGVIGIISNVFLCVIKIVTGFLTSSIAITADGVNNLADAGSSVITLVGFKLSSMPADKEHPYGHQRMEYITGLIVSVIILVIGLLLMKSSITEIFVPTSQILDVRTQLIMLIILGAAIVIKLWQSIFYKKAGKLIASKTLIATATDSLNDCLSTAAVLVSLIVTLFFPKILLDGYMGVVVSIIIIISGIKLIKETMSPLIGEAPSKEFITAITKKVLSYPGILGIHDLVIHSYGPVKTFVSVHAEVDSKVDIITSHDIIDNIERDFLDEKGICLVIHMDPIDTSNEKTIKLKEQVTKIITEIDSELHFHDFRVVHGETHVNILFDIVVPVKYHLSDEELINLITNEIKKLNHKYNLIVTIDRDFVGRD